MNIIDLMIQEYKDRDKIKEKVEFWRACASSNLDSGKWNAMDMVNTGQPAPVSKYLIKYKFRSLDSYTSQLALSNDNGISQMIIDTYMNHWLKVKYNVEITGLNPQEKDRYFENIDNAGTSDKMYDIKIIEELLTVGKVFEAVDSEPETPENFYLCCIPREAVRNYSETNGNFDFITWDSLYTNVTDFNVEYMPMIYAWSKDSFNLLVKGDNGWQLLDEPIDNIMGVVPVNSAQLGESCLPIINISSKWQYNLYNLDSELRSIIRDQGGLNFLSAPQGSEIKVMTNNSVVYYPEGSNPPQWAAYPSSGLDAHYMYWQNAMKWLENISKIRKMNSGESGLAKSYDFINTESLLVALSENLKNLIEKRVVDIGLRIGKDATATVNFDRSSFRVDELDAKIDRLIKLQAVAMPETLKDSFIKKFAQTELQLTDNEIESIYNEWQDDKDELRESMSALMSNSNLDDDDEEEEEQ
jgi:hypothetical protein